MTAECRKSHLAVVLLVVALLLPSGCEARSYWTIRYDGKDYISCANTILLDYRLPGVTSFEDIQNSLLTKIGETKGATVYSIAGLDSGWIYCHYESMLGTGPDGVYHSADVIMDTVSDFTPDSLQVYALTKPTASGSGTEALYGGTKDQTVIDRVVKAILSGKALSPDTLSEAQKRALVYDNAAQYRVEFKSASCPNLIYLYDYTVSDDGKCFVLSDKAGYEATGGLLELLQAGEIRH